MMAMALGGACTIHAQSAPTGAWRSGAITVEFTDEGRAQFTSPRGVLIAAAWRVLGDTMQLRDESGPAACLGEEDPLSDIRNTRAIAAVFQRGRQVVR